MAALTPAWTTFRPHVLQSTLARTPARFVAVASGRRSGKTAIAKRKLVKCLPRQPAWSNPRYFFGGPTRDQAKRIGWDDLLALIPDHWIAGGKHGRNVSYSELKITTIFGSELHVVGLDKPQRIEGVPWDGCVLDESCDLRPKVFDLSVRPALTDRAGWCWRIGVPKRQGIASREYRDFFSQCKTGEYLDGQAFTWPSSDILPAEEINHAKETLDPKDYREQFEASWETAGGAIFHAFEREYNVRPCSYVPTETIIVGADFNVDPMAWVLGHRYADRVEWFDEIWLRDTNTQKTIDVLVGRYGDHAGGWEFYGDASSRARKTSASLSDYQQVYNDDRLKAMGRTVHMPQSNPPVVDRFAACNAMFCNASGKRRMFVDSRCKHLINDLEDRAYRPGTREPNDSGDLGHVTDAMGYPIYRLFPIQIPVTGKKQVIITTG